MAKSSVSDPLLDILGLCFARAAVDRMLAELDSEAKGRPLVREEVMPARDALKPHELGAER